MFFASFSVMVVFKRPSMIIIRSRLWLLKLFNGSLCSIMLGYLGVVKMMTMLTRVKVADGRARVVMMMMIYIYIYNMV